MSATDPHSFTPRGQRAPARYECAHCPYSADHSIHLQAVLEGMVKAVSSMQRPVLCSTPGCIRKCYSGGKCKRCSGKQVVLSISATPELAEMVDRSAKAEGVSRNAWLRGVVARALE